MNLWQTLDGASFDSESFACDDTHRDLSIDDRRIAEDGPEYDSRDGAKGDGTDASTGSAPANRLNGTDLTARCHDLQVLRVAMALVEGTKAAAADRAANVERLRASIAKAAGAAPCAVPAAGEAPPDREAIAARLKSLARTAERNLAEQLRLLVRFADARLYEADGCSSLVTWADRYLGLARTACFERLRIGRALADLPILESLFALGKLSFSQLREITRHATAATDAEFAVATLELSVTETIEYCRRFRHIADRDEDAANAALEGLEAAEAKAAQRAFAQRSLSLRELDAHTRRITIDLPNELAAEFLGSLESVEDWIRGGGEDAEQGTGAADGVSDKIATTDTRPTATQLRADAAVLMSRRSLAHSGDAVAMADRYRVHTHVDVRLLADGPFRTDADEPSERPFIQGHGPISRATARRLAAEAGFTLLATDPEGEVIGTLEVAPPFTKKQLRQMRARDRRCQLPGCGATRHLHGHHLVHREDGGQSTLENAACVCAACHRLLHEGGFSLERLPGAGLDPGPVAAGVDAVDGVEADERSRSRAGAKVARIRRYRLLDAHGREVGGVGAAWKSVGAAVCGSPATRAGSPPTRPGTLAPRSSHECTADKAPTVRP